MNFCKDCKYCSVPCIVFNAYENAKCHCPAFTKNIKHNYVTGKYLWEFCICQRNSLKEPSQCEEFIQKEE